MKLVNNGRKAMTTKAQYEREPLSGCVCNSGSYSAQVSKRVSKSKCVCKCGWFYASGNAATAQEGSSRNGKDGGSGHINI